jgi:hypothetical protein
MPRILVGDDEKDVRAMMSIVLTRFLHANQCPLHLKTL